MKKKKLNGKALKERALNIQLESLADFNQRRTAEHDQAMRTERFPRPNGIACPDCGHELYDVHPYVTLHSNPPTKSVRCKSCRYTGYRVA